tara:strand:+ start:230 stop:1009 length:780 start_codon:yes stop_codon:yes gene_type:complete
MTASDRVRWFPYSYSTKKSDLIYMNQILNCQDEYGCGTKSTCEHDPKWKMFDFEQYFTKDSYDFLTMGCSVSYGTEIKKSETWRHNLNNTIDLSIPGIGIDGIWHNLKYLLSQNKIKFKKIIILLPDLRRRTFKIHKDKHWFSFITTESSIETPHANFAFRPEEMKKLNDRHTRFLMLHGERYGKMVLKRLINWINQNQFAGLFISSWDDDVFAMLKDGIIKKETVLDKFQSRYKKDHKIKHPSPEAHHKWLRDIDHIL